MGFRLNHTKKTVLKRHEKKRIKYLFKFLFKKESQVFKRRLEHISVEMST